jgi:hypothetical protein
MIRIYLSVLVLWVIGLGLGTFLRALGWTALDFLSYAIGSGIMVGLVAVSLVVIDSFLEEE